jgi:hypothetical protein
MKFGKKVIAGALVAAASLLSPAYAQNEPEVYDKNPSISVPIKSPVTNADANTLFNAGANTATGLLLKTLSNAIDVDSPWYRGGETLTQVSIDSLTAAVFHELAHYREAGNLDNSRPGLHVTPQFDLRPFAYGIFSGGETSMIAQYDTPAVLPVSAAELLGVIVAGPNQQHLNAAHIWRTSRAPTRTYQDSAFLLSQLAETTSLFFDPLANDVVVYGSLMNQTGIPVSTARLKRSSEIITLLNLPVYESIAHLVDFIATGEREHTPLSLELGDWTIYAPLFTKYMTAKGEFANIELLIDGPVKFDISFGRDLKFNQPSAPLDWMRFGGTVTIPLDGIRPGLTVAPFVYLNSKRSQLTYEGIATGFGVSYPLVPRFMIDGMVEYQNKDIIERVVKNYQQHFQFLAGFSLRF